MITVNTEKLKQLIIEEIKDLEENGPALVSSSMCIGEVESGIQVRLLVTRDESDLDDDISEEFGDIVSEQIREPEGR